MIQWQNLDSLESFKKLQSLKNLVSIKEELSCSTGVERVKKYNVPMAAGLTYNYGAKEVNPQLLGIFQELANEAQVIEKFASLYNGDVINTGENRKVLHHLLRGQLGADVLLDGKNIGEFYTNQLKSIADFSEKVHTGKITNAKGEKFTQVVQIGIGGSDLGPRAMYLALEQWARANFDIPADEFKEMINQTIFAISDDETRYFMNGVFFEKKGDNLNMVSTDGRRLAFISKEICQGVSDFPSVIVPPKILNTILKRAPSEGMISLAIVDKLIFVKFGNYKFSSVLLEGQFPNYNRVIPEHQSSYFELEKADLVDALKRVALLVDQKARRVYFEVNSGRLVITSQESDIGVAKEEIPCQYDGDVITMAMNYLYIDEPMKVMNSERLRFEFTESMKAVTLKPVPDSDYFHIIMPMQME